MNSTPSFTKLDVDRILRRASEIEGAEDAGPITAEEIRSIAREAGFGAHAVERAIGEAQQAAVTIRRHPVQKTGIVVAHVSARRTIPIEISSEQLMTAVRLLQPYREGAAQVKLAEDKIHWHDRRGIGFTVTSSAGVTEIKVLVSRVMIRKGRWIGWVKAAADRLEALVVLVAAQGAADAAGAGVLLSGPPITEPGRAERARDPGERTGV